MAICFKRIKKPDGQIKVGHYGNVNFGAIRTNGDGQQYFQWIFKKLGKKKL